MNKTYNMQEVLVYFYNEILLKINPNMPDIIQKNKKYIEEHQDDIELFNNFINNTCNKIEQNSNITNREKEYEIKIRKSITDPFQLFDLTPIAYFIKDIKFAEVYLKNEDGTLKKISTNEIISPNKVSLKVGNTLIITPNYNKMYQNDYRFTIIGNLKAITAVIRLNYKSLENNSESNTRVMTYDCINVGDENTLYVDDNLGPRRYTTNYPMLSSPENIEKINRNISKFMLDLTPFTTENNKFIELMKNACPDLNYFDYRSVDYSNISGTLYHEQAEEISINTPAYCNMIYRSNEISKLYRKLSSVPKNNDGYRRFKLNQIFKEEFENSKLTIEELDYVFSGMQNSILRTKDNQDLNKKLQSNKFKEFLSNKSERLQKQNELREKIAAENVIKEEWQNSPEHPNNIRKDELNQIAKTIETLEQLRTLNPMLVSNEQLELITKYKEFLDMYNRETKREHEIDTGMSEESRSWYQNHYSRR